MKSRSMTILAIALAAFTLPIMAGDEAAASLQRLAELQKRAAALSPTSSQDTVLSLLGETQIRGNGGWGHFDTIIWYYLNYIDDLEYRRFSVTFDPAKGTSVQAVELSRKEIAKSSRVVSTGTVLRANRGFPGPGGLLCEVRFTTAEGDILLSLAVETLNRVTGTPEAGAAVRVEHRGPGNDLIFLGFQGLFLESLTFTPAHRRERPGH